MAWRGEVEDGLGWGGLVASKSEQREEARLAALERDAARYRWLRRREAGDQWRYMGGVSGEKMDAQIDAAIRDEGR